MPLAFYEVNRVEQSPFCALLGSLPGRALQGKVGRASRSPSTFAGARGKKRSTIPSWG